MKRFCKVRSLVCDQCGKLVTIRDLPNTKPQRFCSRSCGKQASGTPFKGRMVPCAQCGTEVWRKPYDLAQRSEHFCTRACHRAWEQRTKVIHVCTVCAEPFHRSPYTAKRRTTYCSLACRNRDPVHVARLRQMNADQSFGKRTSIETIGYGMLDDLGVQYEPQHLFKGRFCLDAFVPSVNVAIECDGDYWHGHPEHYPVPNAHQKACISKDRKKARYLEKCGVHLIRFWESDIKKRPEWVRAQLREAVSHDTANVLDGA